MTDAPTPPPDDANDPTVYPAAGRPESKLVLHSNRYATVILNDGNAVSVRPPSVADWRKIMHAYATAQAKVAAVPDGQTMDVLYGYDPADDPDGGDEHGDKEEAPYAEAFALVLRLLGSTTIDADALPLWASSGRLYQTFYDHWRTVDVVLAQPPDDTADTPPDGVGTISDDGAPAGLPLAPAVPPPVNAPGAATAAAGAAEYPVFDLEAAQAEHAAAGTLLPPSGPPVAAGGISGTPGTPARVQPVSPGG